MQFILPAALDGGHVHLAEDDADHPFDKVLQCCELPGGLGLASGIGSGSYLLGGLVFGIALYRAGIVARWAALLLSIGAVASLLAGVLPDSMIRTATWPTAIAMIGLGYWLWREQTFAASASVPSVRTPQLDAANV